MRATFSFACSLLPSDDFMPDQVIMQPASIGASSSESLKHILSGEDIVSLITLEMEGYVPVYNDQGKLTHYTKKLDPKLIFKDVAINWMRGKLAGVLNRNTFLSQIQTPEEMRHIQLQMALSFTDELFFNMDVLGLDINENGAEKFDILCNKYIDVLDFAIRRPLFESDKNLIAKTTSESMQRIQQTVQEQNRGGVTGWLTQGRK